MRKAIAKWMMVSIALTCCYVFHGQAVLTEDVNTASLFPNQNFGGSIALVVSQGANTYLKFNLANLGPITGSNMSKATLVLYTDAVLTAGTVDVYEVDGPWSEGSIAPAGVIQLMVELWGAGGGGGGGAADAYAGQSYAGCSGGGGGYTRGLVTVVPGLTYAMQVGMGGRGPEIACARLR